nr:MAG TPA: hypothetical protein [Caudoviricetes sp.]
MVVDWLPLPTFLHLLGNQLIFQLKYRLRFLRPYCKFLWPIVTSSIVY